MRIGPLKKTAVALAGFSLAAICSCSAGVVRGAGERGAARFHEWFNAGRYREIYVQAGETLRKSESEVDFATRLKIVRIRMGAVKRSNLDGWRVNETPGGTSVYLRYRTEFTEGDAVEDFVFAVSGGQAVLQGYKINSPRLTGK